MAKVVSTVIRRATPFGMTPVALSLAACGGGGGNGGEADTTSRVGTISSAISFAKTGNAFTDATTQGSYWSPSDNILTYAVANGFNGEEWDDPAFVKSRLDEAMQEITYFTGLQVKNLGLFSDPSAAANAGATIVLSLDSIEISASLGNSVWAVGFFPDTEPYLYDHMAGDIFLNLNSAAATLPTHAYNVGGAGFTLLLHELGHALGLKHPHDDGGTGRPTYAEVGYSGFEDQTYTVMAYNDEFGSITNAPGTFMLADTLALMELYGVNHSTNSGDTTHIIEENGLRKTIWDASGVDTIDLSGCVNDTVVFLTSIRLNQNVDIAYSYVTVNAYTADAKLSWLLGDFENVTAGSGNDQIDGNDLDNIIIGNSGDDTIDGWGGDDTMYGGAGNDIFLKGIGEGDDIIKDFEVGVDSCWFFDGVNFDDSIASLSSTVEGYALYTLTDNSTLLLEGTLYSDLVAIA